MDRVSNRIGTQIERPVDYAREVGESLGNIKPEVGPALSPDIAPLATPQSMELIGGARNLEQLRLAVPEAANPGARPDHMMARNVVARSQDAVSKQLINVLQQPPKGLSEQSISLMRASAAREGNMVKLLKTLLGSMEEIHHRIIGSQGG